jgi:ribosomal protein RSM22 (predicted rRNA methylase)
VNTAELKLNIIRQVDTLNEDVLKEVTDYIQSKINSQNASVFESLTEEQKKGIRLAQQSIKDGKGIPHEAIVLKYKTKYGIN